ncbi:hypothetical protein FKP32DRAFT_1589019 [Trametes sanguinea]|nr:hypothetical protein FKP32DRAFT_1589019 [Trametes sanguinea]
MSALGDSSVASSVSTLDDWLDLAKREKNMPLEDLVALFNKVVPDPGESAISEAVCLYGPEYDDRFDEVFKARFELGGNVDLARHVMGVYTRHTRVTAISRLWAEHEEARREYIAARNALDDFETTRLSGDLEDFGDSEVEAELRRNLAERDERCLKIREVLVEAKRRHATIRTSGQYRDWKVIEVPPSPKKQVSSSTAEVATPSVLRAAISSPRQDSSPAHTTDVTILPVSTDSKNTVGDGRRSSSVVDEEMVGAVVDAEEASAVDELEDQLRSSSSVSATPAGTDDARRRKLRSSAVVANGHPLARRWISTPLPAGVSSSDAYVGWTQFPRNIKFDQKEKWEAAINDRHYRLPGQGLFLRWEGVPTCDRCSCGTRRSPCGFKGRSAVCIACLNGPKNTECTYGGDEGHSGYVTVDGGIPCGSAPELPFVRFNGLGFSFRLQELSMDLWEEVFALVEQGTHAMRRGDWSIIDAAGLANALNGYYPSGRHETAFPPDIEDELRERVGVDRFNGLPRTIVAKSTTDPFPPLYVTSKTTRALQASASKGVKRKIAKDRFPSVEIVTDSDSDVHIQPRKKRRLRPYAQAETDVIERPSASDSVPSLIILEAERLYRLAQARKIEAVMLDKYKVHFSQVSPPALLSCQWYGCTERHKHRVTKEDGADGDETALMDGGHET